MSATTGLDNLRFYPLGTPMRPLASPTPVGFTPAQIRDAYNVDGITVRVGTNDVPVTGAGTTIAIVAAYNHPTIRGDLTTFNEQFNLPQMTNATFRIVNQTGGANLPPSNAQWATEIALDVQWAHVMAPGAKILLVCANSDSARDLFAAVDYAKKQAGVVVVSNSWGTTEYRNENRDDYHFVTPPGHSGVTFVFSSGDFPGVSYPATSPNVLAVGGTNLTLTNQDEIMAETPWASTGGGVSEFQPAPRYQTNLGYGKRTTPDVSFVGDTLTGVAVYDSFGAGGWLDMGGSSVGAPAWSGLLALAGHGRILQRKAQLSNAQVALYGIGGGSFFDVGPNGYDLQSGRGSPRANLIIRDLVGFTGSTALPPSLPPATPTNTRPGGWWWETFFPLAQAGTKSSLLKSVSGSIDVVPGGGTGDATLSKLSTKVTANDDNVARAAQTAQLVWAQFSTEVESSLRASRKNHFAQHAIGANLAALDSFFAS